MKKNPVTKKLRGAIKPIFSQNFRDRFQVDLIDFRRLRKRDPFGVLMRWAMTLKDHFSGLTYICALPRKRANLVAYKLQEIFGVIGYPKIFHTDNGKEFTAKCVLQLLRHKNPNILSVTGRPRTPRDQGSVENLNKLVKRVVGMVLAERREAGENPNWTEVLGSVAATINSQCGRGKYDKTAFETVYGQMFDFPLTCSKSEARKCWTVPQRMKVTSDPEFSEFCQTNYILDDAEEAEDDPANDDSGYFSDDDLPADEADEVDDDEFYAHLMDDPPIITPTKSVKPASTVEDAHEMGNNTSWEPDDDNVATENAGQSDEENVDDRKPPPETLTASNDANPVDTAEAHGHRHIASDDTDSPAESQNKATDAKYNNTLAQYDDQGITLAPSCNT